MITRRDFLKLAGMSGGMMMLLPNWLIQAEYGRILEHSYAYAHPSHNGTRLKRLLPDSVYPILGYQGELVRLSNGYVPREFVQPMIAVTNKHLLSQLPAYAEVVAPYAAVHQWAAIEAPLVMRLGNGAMIYATRQLEDRHAQNWIEVTLSDSQSGWIQAPRLQPIELLVQYPPTRSAVIDRQTKRLTLYADKERILSHFDLVIPPTLSPATTHIVDRKLNDRQPHYGTPWVLMAANGLTLSGAYWHNRFLTENPDLSNRVELSVISARWLYEFLPNGTRLIIK